jgi:hypothetical protein
MKLNIKTEPLPQYVTHVKTAGMKYTRTNYQCPLCQIPFSKREFEDHVYKVHATRADECFAKLFGVPWPARCTCGRELHYSTTHKGFQTTCGNCTAGTITGVAEYKNADEAKKAEAQLKAMLLHAQAEAKRLAKEAELDRIPLNELPFPSRKDPRMLRRIAKELRVYAINGEKDKLIQLANFLDSQLAKI